MRAIPTFPRFATLTSDHKEDIDLFNRNFEPYSDFNFTSLFSWQGNQKTEISNLNNNLIIRMPDYTTNAVIYSVLGKNHIDSTFETLLNLTDELKLVPGITISNLKDRGRFHITEDRDNFDYIYSTESLVSLTGADYKKIRNKLSDFRRDHQTSIVTTSVTRNVSQEYMSTLLTLNNHWAVQSKDIDATTSEAKAIEKLLQNADFLDIFIVELLIDNEVKGFSINEILSKGYGICHFEKTLKSHHANINHFLVHEVATLLKELGIHTVNWEQDLGIEGLRRAKLSYKPSSFLRKYCVNSRS